MPNLFRTALLALIVPLSGPCHAVRIVTFGDSNTDVGWEGAKPTPVAYSYVSADHGRASARAANSPTQLAGKIEALGRSHGVGLEVVNHGIAGTGTGAVRHAGGAPGARTVVAGVTRFEAEVLGRGSPWSGGEPVSAEYPKGAIVRTRAFTPTPLDFVYVSMGTNDAGYGLSAAASTSNIAWMIARWTEAGLPVNHFLLTTLAPRTGELGKEIPALNDSIRALAGRTGVPLIDLAKHTSNDNGRSWRSADMQVGDGVHYSESVRDWLAGEVVRLLAASIR